jgi:hypothetical protein
VGKAIVVYSTRAGETKNADLIAEGIRIRDQTQCRQCRDKKETDLGLTPKFSACHLSRRDAAVHENHAFG